MASGWAYFRKHWIKPEVYPLIGAMSAALGVCGYAMFNKARDPTLGWNKAKRKNDLYGDVEEVVPIWISAKQRSTSIFSSSREIAETNKMKVAPMDPITIKIGDAEEEEEEDEPELEDQSTQESHPVEKQSPPSDTAVDVVDEAADTINAAIDAAIQSSAASLSSEPSEQTASSIAENPPPPQNVQPTSASAES